MHLIALLFALLVAPLGPIITHHGPSQLAGAAPVVQNPGFEWNAGYHEQAGIPGLVPNGWTARILTGNPMMSSTDHWAKQGCGPGAFVERLEEYDSLVFLAVPTKCGDGFVAPPFDATVFQPVQVEPGTEYSLSTWMVSLCGGSASPNTCPAGAYISKLTGLDPTGGTDPLSDSVHWTEDRRSHIEARWVDLIDATTAQSSTLTLFVRISSPFLHEGNHAFADAVKLVRAPQSAFVSVEKGGSDIAVSWTGSLGPDIPAIPATNHKLSFEIQARTDGGSWQPWLSGQGVGQASVPLSSSCVDRTYQFRIRAWAIQPDGQPGAWPNHHFIGPWHESLEIEVDRATDCPQRLFLPAGQQ